MGERRTERMAIHSLAMGEAASQVAEEATRAQHRYGLPASTHESFGVLAEEVAELLEAIHQNDREAIAIEAKQVAAVALRLYSAVIEERSSGVYREFDTRSNL